MLFAAYVLFVLGVIASSRSGRLHTRPGVLPSVLQVGVAACLVAVGAAVVLGAGQLRTAQVIGALLVVGGIVYVVGALIPDSLLARSTRLVAAVAITAGLAFPSTLTLALPVACVLYWGSLGGRFGAASAS